MDIGYHHTCIKFINSLGRKKSIFWATGCIQYMYK